MHLYPVKRGSAVRRLLWPLLLFALVIGLFLYGFGNVAHAAAEEEQRVLEDAIRRSLVNCYAIEGAYPADLSYLEDHYGLLIDREHYVVDYQPFGGNIWPSVQVVRRGDYGGTPPDGGAV